MAALVVAIHGIAADQNRNDPEHYKVENAEQEDRPQDVGEWCLHKRILEIQAGRALDATILRITPARSIG